MVEVPKSVSARDDSNSVREATISDLETISDFRLEFVASIKSLSETEAKTYRRGQAKMFRRLMESGDYRLWVYESDGAVHGTCALDLSESRGSGELSAVFTRRDKRRLGIASTLLEKAIDFAVESKLERIVLQPTDLSLELYKKFGFKKIGGRMELLLADRRTAQDSVPVRGSN